MDFDCWWASGLSKDDDNDRLMMDYVSLLDFLNIIADFSFYHN